MTYIREVVDTPRLLPAPFGLVNPETLVKMPGDVHWENGFSYEVTTSNVYGKSHDFCNYTATQGATFGTALGSAPTNGSFWLDYSPLYLEAAYVCRSSIGMSPEDRKARAADALELLTTKLLERELWTNGWQNTENTFGNRSFTNANVITPIGTTAVKLRIGLAALENALTSTEVLPVQGAIHVTRDVLSVLRVDMSGVQDRDGVMWTPAGNMLIGGSGYPGTGPTGQARTNTTAWMFATGPVAVRLGTINVNDVPSKVAGPVGTESYSTTNTLVYTAERAASATFNSANVYAVLVDLTL